MQVFLVLLMKPYPFQWGLKSMKVLSMSHKLALMVKILISQKLNLLAMVLFLLLQQKVLQVVAAVATEKLNKLKNLILLSVIKK
jgi:hypothetical protein